MWQGKFEDAKGVTISRKSVGQTINGNGQKKEDNQNTTILNVSGLYEIKIKLNVRLPTKIPSTHKNIAASSFFHSNTLVDNKKK